MRVTDIIFLSLLSTNFLWNCSEEGITDLANDSIVFSKEIQPIFNSKCISCHGQTVAEENLRLDSWDQLIRGSLHSESIIPYDPDNSLLYEMLTKLETPHLSGTDSIMQDELRILRDWIAEGAMDDEGHIPHEAAAEKLYVCNQGSGMVSVIELNTWMVIRNIKFKDLGFSDNSKPHDITVDETGNWYVSLIGDGKVLKFDVNYNLLGDVDFSSAGLLALNTKNSILYAGHTLSNPDVPQTLAAINYQDMTLTNISLPYTRPHALATHFNSNYVFNLSLVDNRIAVINSESNPENVENVQILPGENRTIVQLTIAPDNNSAVLSSQFDQKLLILDISNIAAINVVDSVMVGHHPWHPKYSGDGSKIFVGNNVSNTVSVVNTSSYQQEQLYGIGDGSDGLAQPHGLVVSNGNPLIYVSNRNTNGLYTPRYNFGDNANTGTIVVINTELNQTEKVIEIEKFPSGLALSAAQEISD